MAGDVKESGSDCEGLGIPNLDFNLKAVGSHQRFLQRKVMSRLALSMVSLSSVENETTLGEAGCRQTRQQAGRKTLN